MDRPIPRWLPVAVFAVIALATLFWVVNGDEALIGPTGSMGDDVYFENIAFHLARGEGIKFDFSNPEWRKPYEEFNEAGQSDWILALECKPGLTTSRSPGFPMMVALIYRIVGRRFVAVRVVNCVVLAAALTWLVMLVFRRFGAIAGWLACLQISLDMFVLRTAGQFMTEALGTAIACALFVCCASLAGCPATGSSTPTADRRRRGWCLVGWLFTGLLFGFGTLVRANLNAWFPLIVAGLFVWIAWRWMAGKELRVLIWPALLFCAGIIVVAAPYWVRNCRVTGGFTPFGTSGSFGLIGGYCDRAWQQFGNWSIEDSVESQRKTMQKEGFADRTLAEQEYWMGQDSVAAAEAWAWENRFKLPALVGMKAISHLGYYRQPLALQVLNGVLFFGALVGCWFARRNFGIWVIVFWTLSLVATSLTWSHFGRYSIPLRPIMHVACAVGTVMLWSRILGLNHQPATTD